ncbi:MAG: NAD-dependent epimerase/dehydratase family protein [Candidatus Kariarchaeaceae archaeon]|jgi:nucleoside-diphosphate-sugar epimerase
MTNTYPQNYALVLGVTGGLGAAVARELVKQNTEVIGINRSGEAHPLMVPSEVDVRAIDIYNREALLPLLQGADIVYHCLNLPYAKWKSELLELTDYIISVVEEADVPMVISDNLYMYGEDLNEPRHEALPHNSQIVKGQIRSNVAKRYQEAHDEGRIRMIMVRGPSYYGAGSLDTSHYGDRIFSKVLQGKRALFVGDPDVEHTTIHVGDFARAMIILGADEEAYGQAWHAPCPPPMRKSEFSNLAYTLAGKRPIPPLSAGKYVLSLLGIFNKDIAEVKEMLYEFERPYYVDHSKFMARYPDFRITPIEEGIKEALEWYSRYLDIQSITVTH